MFTMRDYLSSCKPLIYRFFELQICMSRTWWWMWQLNFSEVLKGVLIYFVLRLLSTYALTISFSFSHTLFSTSAEINQNEYLSGECKMCGTHPLSLLQSVQVQDQSKRQSSIECTDFVATCTKQWRSLSTTSEISLKNRPHSGFFSSFIAFFLNNWSWSENIFFIIKSKSSINLKIWCIWSIAIIRWSVSDLEPNVQVILGFRLNTLKCFTKKHIFFFVYII